jgi:hypothetical protein
MSGFYYLSKAFLGAAIVSAFTSPHAMAQITTPVDIVYHYRDGGCFNDQRERGRNAGAMVECGALKGRVAFGLAGVDLVGFFGQYLFIPNLPFLKIRFANTRLELAKFDRTKISDSDVTNSDWRGAVMNGVEFDNTRFQDVDFRGMKLNDVTFRNCYLKNVNLEGATFYRVRFINTRTENLNMNFVSKNFVSGLSL